MKKWGAVGLHQHLEQSTCWVASPPVLPPASVHLLCLGWGRTEVMSFFKSLYLGFTLRRFLFLILCFFPSLSRSATGTPCPCSDLSGAINQLPTSAPMKCRLLEVSRSLLGRPLFQVSVSHSMWYKNTGGAQVRYVGGIHKPLFKFVAGNLFIL